MLFQKPRFLQIKRAVLLPILLVFIQTVSTPAYSSAETQSFQAKIRSMTGLKGILSSSSKARSTGAKGVRSIPPVQSTLLIRGVGVTTVSFDRQWFPSSKAYFDNGRTLIPDHSQAIFLRGTLTLRQVPPGGGEKVRVTRPVSATIFFENGTAERMEISFVDQNRPGRSPRLYEIKIPQVLSADLHSAVAHHVPARIYDGKRCGTTAQMNRGRSHRMDTAMAKAALEISPQATVRVVRVSTDADYEWYQRYGQNSITEITSMLNMVSTIYEAQLGLSIEVGTQLVVTTPNTRYLQTDAELLIEGFRIYTEANHHLGSADLYHLFSGKDWDGNTLGIAYIGVTCSAPSFSYGATQDVSSALKGIITAHEIGHNFNADHDDSLPTTIMSTSVNISSLPTQFSNFSISEITNYVAANNSCLPFKSVTPTPTATPAPTTPGGATPTPVSNPNNGGGGGTPGSPTPMPVALAVTVTRSGVFSSTLSLSSPSADCSVGVRVATSQKKVTRGALVLSTSAASAEQRFEFTVARKVKKRNTRRKTQFAYLIAEQSCPGGTPTYSSVVTLEPFRIAVPEKPVSLKQWLREFRDQFSAALPSS